LNGKRGTLNLQAGAVDNIQLMGNIFYQAPVTGKRVPERRTGIDRRAPRAFSSVFKSRFRRRKDKGRRKTDQGAYVDLYDSRSWSVAITVLILSCMDAVMTALHMIRGSARELNPVMNAVISYAGLPAFIVVKVTMTSFPMAILLIHKEWTMGKYAARLCLWSYILISLYHLYLVFAAQ
jgi:hypothetical protein